MYIPNGTHGDNQAFICPATTAHLHIKKRSSPSPHVCVSIFCWAVELKAPCPPDTSNVHSFHLMTVKFLQLSFFCGSKEQASCSEVLVLLFLFSTSSWFLTTLPCLVCVTCQGSFLPHTHIPCSIINLVQAPNCTSRVALHCGCNPCGEIMQRVFMQACNLLSLSLTVRDHGSKKFT